MDLNRENERNNQKVKHTQIILLIRFNQLFKFLNFNTSIFAALFFLNVDVRVKVEWKSSRRWWNLRCVWAFLLNRFFFTFNLSLNRDLKYEISFGEFPTQTKASSQNWNRCGEEEEEGRKNLKFKFGLSGGVGSNSSPLFAIQKYIIIIFYLGTDKSLCTTPLFALPVGSCDNLDDIMMSMLCYLMRTKMWASRVGTACSYYMDF